jgi:hypothetical protein
MPEFNRDRFPLSNEDRDAMDGVMLTPTGEYRNGPVVVLLRESTP